MRLDQPQLVELAASTGFRKETLEKVDRLVGLLEDVNRHPLLSRVLALKGGTALNLGFGPPSRLSVDLDFNYIGAAEREAMLAQRPDVERALESIARAQGYTVQRSKDEHAWHKYFMEYSSAFGARDRVEADLNFLHRVPIGPPVRLGIWRPDGETGFSVQAVGLEELSAGKMCALLDRVLPRDCFDVIRLPGIIGERWDGRLRLLFIALAGALDRPLQDYGEERLERVTQAAVAEQLHPSAAAELVGTGTGVFGKNPIWGASARAPLPRGGEACRPPEKQPGPPLEGRKCAEAGQETQVTRSPPSRRSLPRRVVRPHSTLYQIEIPA